MTSREKRARWLYTLLATCIQSQFRAVACYILCLKMLEFRVWAQLLYIVPNSPVGKLKSCLIGVSLGASVSTIVSQPSTSCLALPFLSSVPLQKRFCWHWNMSQPHFLIISPISPVSSSQAHHQHYMPKPWFNGQWQTMWPVDGISNWVAATLGGAKDWEGPQTSG